MAKKISKDVSDEFPKELEPILKEMSKLTEKCASLQSENENLNKQIQKLQKDNDQLSKAVNDTPKAPVDSVDNTNLDVEIHDDNTAIYRLSLELETYRHLIETKDAQLDHYREEESNRYIENTLNTSNANTYESLYNKKVAEYNRLSLENETNAAKIASLQNTNDAYKKEITRLLKQLGLKDKENSALLASKLASTSENLLLIAQESADNTGFRSPVVQKKSKRKKTASTYEAWKAAYESGITDEKEMERRDICSARTHFRNILKYKKEQEKK